MISRIHALRASAGRLATAFVLAVSLGACSPPDNASADKTPQTDAALMDTARAIHQQSLVLDAHADIVIPSTSLAYIGADGLSKVEPSKLKAGGVGAVVMSIAVGPGPRTPEGDAEARAEADEKLAAVTALVAANPDTLAFARTPEEITAIRAGGRTAIVLGFQNARSLERNVDALDVFYAAGARVFALNHLAHNDFADSSRPMHDPIKGAYEPDAHGGLSPLGIAAIERINALGGIVDVSQSSKAATLQMISLSKAPVIASHSNVRAISNATRNLSDEEIDRIGATGGVIHVAPFSAYLINFSTPERLEAIKAARSAAGLPAYYSYPFELYWELEDPAAAAAYVASVQQAMGPADTELMVDHIDYIVKRIGIDHVGVGTDFNHGSGIDGYEDASDSLNLTLALVRRGYSAEDIQKIWGGNFMRVFAQAQRLATKPGAQ